MANTAEGACLMGYLGLCNLAGWCRTWYRWICVQDFTGHAFSCSVRGIAIAWMVFVPEFSLFEWFWSTLSYQHILDSICMYLSRWNNKCNRFLSLFFFFFYLEKNHLWCFLFVAVVSLRSFYLLFAVSQLEWLKVSLNWYLYTIQKYRILLHLSCLRCP